MKILTFSTYRIDAPRHGGQVRLSAIHTVLRSKGWTTQNLAVYAPSPGEASENDEWLFSLDGKFHEYLHSQQGRTDVDAADYILRNPDLFDDAVAKIDEFEPDVFWLEQPWLWPLVAEYKQVRPSCRAKIVYGSQNVEAALIRNVLGPITREAAERIISKTEKIENDICLNADVIVGVSMADLSSFRRFGKPIQLVENGVWPRVVPSGVEYWRKELKQFSTVLFVGSAHPPNAAGFQELLGDNLSYLAPNERIIVLGSVTSLLEKPGYYPANRGLNLSRLLPVGMQDASGLSTLIELAKGVILPISEGGGTNLKTAEALYNRKRIVATSTAMRGFEDFIDFPGVSIGDTKDDFVANMKRVLADNGAPLTGYTDRQTDLLDSLIWTSRLEGLPGFLGRLTGDARANQGPSSRGFTPTKDAEFTVLSPGRLRPFLGQGWHDFERQGTWSKEKIAILKIEMRTLPPGPVFVSAFVEFYVPSSKKVQLEIYTPTGHKSSHTVSRSNRKQVINITLSDLDFDDEGLTEIYFESDALFHPNEHSRSQDIRRIGFRVNKLHIGLSPMAQSSAGSRGPRRLSELLWRTVSTRSPQPRR
ncbi:hypothetical protein [Methylobacterium soli]|uniref:Glycosyltransferase family 4 protein n=1 Tax=Methylobacterium soli TaxID=553447 RepID=A0A6L3T153_9HYPH|nr:hypothetical protein [Methylobacterium soli]KAB1079669.1 hypothetical protein F6X53_10340 [Methylobacterium soli]GJE43736.1 hypothetical protein AEGHOMDF_2915 [Methylobacterium soli]